MLATIAIGDSNTSTPAREKPRHRYLTDVSSGGNLAATIYGEMAPGIRGDSLFNAQGSDTFIYDTLPDAASIGFAPKTIYADTFPASGHLIVSKAGRLTSPIVSVGASGIVGVGRLGEPLRFWDPRRRAHGARAIEESTDTILPYFSRIDPLPDFEEYTRANWDGEGAQAIDRETLRTARAALDRLSQDWPAPHAAPSPDGTIGFEWWRDDARAYADFGPGNLIRTYLGANDGSPSEEETFRWGDGNYEERLRRLLSRLFHGQASSTPKSWWESAVLLLEAIV